MTSRLFLYAFASSLLLSCTPVQQEAGTTYNTYDRTVNLPIAKSRGVNIDVMDDRLEDILYEANSIETQVERLVNRLNELRQEIAGYSRLKVHRVTAETLEPQLMIPVEVESKSNASIITQEVPEAEMKERTDVATQKPQSLKPQSQNQIKTKKVEEVVKPQSAILQKGVTDIRIGKHAAKTRIVFDINGSTKHTKDFDREAGVVTITLPETKWATNNSQTYKLPQLSGYEAKSSNNGTIIAMAIQNTSSIQTETLRSTNGKPARLVIDLMK